MRPHALLRPALSLTLTLTTVVAIASGVAAQNLQNALSAADAFWATAGTLAGSPITTSDQFRALEPMLKRIGFAQVDSDAWRYSNLGDIVVLRAYPEQGKFFVELMPGTAHPIGDATLAALIGKASLVSFDEGDSVDLLLSERHSTKQGYSMSDSVYLHFKLSGGMWWKTSRVIEWSK